MMRILLVLCLWMPIAEAATVCRVISTEQVAETYSATQPDGHCARNLMSAGIPAADIEQLTVTEPERAAQVAAWSDHANNPEKAKRQANVTAEAKRNADRATGRVKLKALGLSEDEVNALGLAE